METYFGKPEKYSEAWWKLVYADEQKNYLDREAERRRKEVMWNWIKCLSVALPVLFIVACSVNIATEKERAPDFCLKDMNDGGYCEVFWRDR